MKVIYCFSCNGLREAKGAASKDWGFGPRHFCAACAPRVAALPAREDRASVWLNKKAPECVEPARSISAIRRLVKAPLGVTSMAQWVREHAALPVEELCQQLVAAFPDSKPGKNPKLAKGYVTCYLRKAG